jgi:hypothetical protein
MDGLDEVVWVEARKNESTGNSSRSGRHELRLSLGIGGALNVNDYIRAL